jgi:uncharacterized protein YqeY
MPIKDRLQAHLKEAIRSRDSLRKSVIRLTLTAISHVEARRGRDLDESEAAAVLHKEARKRRETIEELQSAGRPVRLAREKAELAFLETYLPRLMTREEIRMRALQVIEDIGASGPVQVGPVMSRLMSELRGRADGRTVNQVVRELLSG